MALSDLEHLRKLLDDDSASEHEIAIASGAESEFYVTNPPMTAGSAVVKVDEDVKVLGVDYTIGERADRVIFAAPPAEGSRVEIEYTRLTWPDSELEHYLTVAGLDWPAAPGLIYKAAIYALDGLLMGASAVGGTGGGDEAPELAAVGDRLLRLRAALAGELVEQGRRPLTFEPVPDSPPVEP